MEGLKMDAINPNVNYLNPATGSVDTGESWLAEFEARDTEIAPTWKDWAPKGLVEVVKNAAGDWEQK